MKGRHNMKKPNEKTEREKLDDMIVKIKAINLKLNKWFDLLPIAVQIIVPTALSVLVGGLTLLVTTHWSIGFLATALLVGCSRGFYLWKQRKVESPRRQPDLVADSEFTPGFHYVSYDSRGILRGTCSRCGERDVDITTHVCRRPRRRFTR